MPRYIDANKLIKKNLEDAMLQPDFMTTAILNAFNTMLMNEEEVDVQPVKHGKWILTGDEQLDNIYFGNKCSECGFIYCGNFFNYCPECGAKMDKE